MVLVEPQLRGAEGEGQQKEAARDYRSRGLAAGGGGISSNRSLYK